MSNGSNWISRFLGKRKLVQIRVSGVTDPKIKNLQVLKPNAFKKYVFKIRKHVNRDRIANGKFSGRIMQYETLTENHFNNH